MNSYTKIFFKNTRDYSVGFDRVRLDMLSPISIFKIYLLTTVTL